MIDHEGHNLAFILGLPRSGTTLLSVILDRHPQVLCPPEPWIMLALESVGKVCIRHPADSRLMGQAVSEFLDQQEITEGARAYATAVYNRKLTSSGKTVFVDKTPRYYHVLPFVRQTFREAKWIWLQRNPLDVAASYKRSWHIELPRTLADGAEYPVWNFDLVIGLERLLHDVDRADPRVLTIQYEQLVNDPENCTAQVMQFLGLEAVPGQCEFNLGGSSFVTSFAGDKKIAETARPHAQSIGTWKGAFNRDELQLLADFIGADTFRQLGYCRTLDELKDLGIEDRGPHATAERRDRIHRLYADRWADIQAAAKVDVPIPWLRDLETQKREQATSIERLNTALAQTRQREQDLTLETQRLKELSESRAAELSRLGHQSAEARAAAEAERDQFQKQLTEQNRLIGDLQRENAEYKSRPAQAAPPQRLRHRFWQQFKQRAQQAIIGFPHAIGKNRQEAPLPPITIVTPVFNGESHIREAIESVLSQNYPRLQYIVVDGGSTDRTLEIIHEYKDRIDRIISEKDNGMYDAIAKGFELSTGEVLGYLNSDDLYEPGGLLRVGEYFRDHPKSQIAYHEDTVWFDGWKFPNRSQPPRIDRLTLLKGHIMFQDGVFFRREAYFAVGGLNRLMRRAGDWDLWVRLSGSFRMHRAEPHISCFRIRPGQISQDMDSYFAELETSKKRWLNQIGSLPLKVATVRHWTRRIYNLLWRTLVPRPLFYPLDQSGCIYGFHPTPAVGPQYIPDQPRSPLSDERPSRLLFSSRDTRFGDERVSYIYYCDKNELTVTYPPLSQDELTALHDKNYSRPDAPMYYPPIEQASPYRDYRGGNALDRLACRWVKLLGRFGPTAVGVAGRIVSWRDRTTDQVLHAVRDIYTRRSDVAFLDVGCFDGTLMSDIGRRTNWTVCGLEPSGSAAEAARSLGFQVWQGLAEDASFIIPQEISFDVIHIGQTIEHFIDPLTVVRRLRGLLKPGGRIVLSTPNLWSNQVKLFGPTWAHWHPPYHRHIFSRKSLTKMAELADMEMTRCRSYSHPYWSCMSVQLNRLGAGGAVPHTAQFPPEIVHEALGLTFWSRLFWDWRGKGDYLVAVFRKR